MNPYTSGTGWKDRERHIRLLMYNINWRAESTVWLSEGLTTNGPVTCVSFPYESIYGSSTHRDQKTKIGTLSSGIWRHEDWYRISGQACWHHFESKEVGEEPAAALQPDVLSESCHGFVQAVLLSSTPHLRENKSDLRWKSVVHVPRRHSQDKDKVKVTLLTNGQSVSMSWCRAQTWDFWPEIFYSKVTVLSFWGALSDERSGLSCVRYCKITRGMKRSAQ
jgi:hypothetical protein